MASLLGCMYFDVGYSIEASAGYVWLEQIHDNMIAVQFYVSSYYHGFQNYRELELCRAHTPRAYSAIYRFIFGAWLYFCELERNNGNAA